MVEPSALNGIIPGQYGIGVPITFMNHEPSYFLPQNHAYAEHPTYTGNGCATCGKPRNEHKQENAK